MDDQSASLFFQRLPQELRNNIYQDVFSLRLAFGKRLGPYRYNLKPPPNGLSLLKTCRRARAEIGSAWMGLVRFHFETYEAMARTGCLSRSSRQWPG